MILVIGIDAATWTIIKPNLQKLPTLEQLCKTGDCRELVLKETPISPSVWCSIFSGKTPEQHKHHAFVVNGNIVKRQDIEVDFIWDILQREGRKVKAFNIPFIVPTYSFGVDFKPIGFGLPTNEKEWQQELETVTGKTKELLREKPDLLIPVYTLLDRVQHFHWGEESVLDWYMRIDKKLGEIVFDTGFLDNKDNRLIIISDHGFCSFGEAKVQTLPQKSEWGELKGDHHEKAILITAGFTREITKPQDVFFAIREML